MSTMAGVGIAAGAAKRRRERRLRSWLRHERMTVAMALAEVTHHTAPRGQKTARAREEERDELYDAKGLMTLPPSRPTPLVEVRPQGRVLRHAVEGLGEFAPMVQILDAPVPQMVDYVAEAFRLLDRPIAEQVIEEPKFSCSACPSRCPVPVPQSAEQLVEVPTVLTPPASPCGLRNRSLTFQPLLVEFLAFFKVFSQNGVRRSGLLRRSLTFQFLVVEVPAVFLVLSPDMSGIPN